MARNGDPIPKDHISAMEAFDIYRNAKRGKGCNEQPPRGTAEWNAWYKQYSTEIDEDESALLQPFLDGELEALVSKPGEKEYRITPADLTKAEWPTRFFISDDIADFSDGPLAKFTGRTPYINRDQFIKWLRRWLKEWLIAEMSERRINQEQASERAQAVGLAPIDAIPDPKLFNPMVEPDWTLTMAVAWIAWRSDDSVRRSWKKYCDAYWFSVREHTIGPGGEVRGGWHLKQATPNIVRLGLEEANDRAMELGFPTITVKDARAMLWRKLGDATIHATGIDEKTWSRKRIEPFEWQDLELVEERDQDALMYHRGKNLGLVGYRLPSISSKDIVGAWPQDDNPPTAPTKVSAIVPVRLSNRPPDKRNEALRILKSLDQEKLSGKREALLAEVNSKTTNTISLDTLRRALKELTGAKG